jgi:predicted nucleic acid-binding protein
VLVDTSVWIDHFRSRNSSLTQQLDAGEVWSHAFVIGELACGTLTHRSKVLTLLAALPAAPLAEHDEVLRFIDARRLFGKGLGWIDLHLLVSAHIFQLPFWTLDKRLAVAALELGLEAPAPQR